MVLIWFLLAGLTEIGGGYLIWICLREGKPWFYGFLGGLSLFVYGIIATFPSFPSFGRVYAAYEWCIHCAFYSMGLGSR